MKFLFERKNRILVLSLILLIVILCNIYYFFFTKNSTNIPSIDLKKMLLIDKLPKHVAVMMDGNGRWARKQGKPRVFGHKHSLQSVEEAIKVSVELGISYLTLYAFSTENWERPQQEVDTLMRLIVNTLSEKLTDLVKNNVVLQVIGDIKRLPKNCQNEIFKAIEATRANTGLRLIVALSYSGRWDIMEASKALAADILNHKIKPDDINTEIFKQYLSTKNIPDPDLLIRTGGDMRISNYLLWQFAYTELVFLEKYWPDFRREDFLKALITYQQRDRRFGKIPYKS